MLLRCFSSYEAHIRSVLRSFNEVESFMQSMDSRLPAVAYPAYALMGYFGQATHTCLASYSGQDARMTQGVSVSCLPKIAIEDFLSDLPLVNEESEYCDLI